MPREFVILSAEPVTAVEVVTAAAAVDGGLGATPGERKERLGRGHGQTALARRASEGRGQRML